VLLDDMVHAAFEAGLQRFEMLGDEDPYKQTWTSNVRERVAFHAFAPRFAGRIDQLAFTHGRRIARRLRMHSGQLRSRVGIGVVS
jgi:CelD/BcsL family acetyltransferase involved in cellulose biosynthesis